MRQGFRRNVLDKERLTRATQQPHHRARLSVELLEDRTVPAVVSWTGAADGISVNNPANWNTLTVPGPPDDAVIDSFMPGLIGGTNLSVNSLTSNCPLSFSGSLSLAEAGSFSDSLVVNGLFTVAAGAHVVLGGGGDVVGDVAIGAGGDVTFTAGVVSLGTGVDFTGLGWARVAGATVNLVGDVTADRFELASGTLEGTSRLTVAEEMKWAGGTLTGMGGVVEIAAGAELSIEGSATKTLSGRVIDNYGTTTWAGAGSIQAEWYAIFNNHDGATFDVQGSGNWLDPLHESVIQNGGLFVKSAGAGVTEIGACLNNTGTVEVAQGTLRLLGIDTSSGTYLVAAGRQLEFAGLHNLVNGASIVGAGLGVVLNQGVVNVQADVQAWYFGILPGGTLDGAGTLTVTNGFFWFGGTMKGTGATKMLGTLYVQGTANKTLETRTLTLESGAQTIWEDGDITLSGNAVIRNQPGAIFSIRCDKVLSGNAGTRFQNDGRVEKTVGDPNEHTLIDLKFENHGTDFGLGVGQGGVFVTSGTLWFAGEGRHSSRFVAAATNSMINFAGDTHVCQAGTEFGGPGLNRVGAAGVLEIPNGVTVDSVGKFELATGGVIRGISGWTPSATTFGRFRNLGTFEWSAGRIQNLVFANTTSLDITTEGQKVLRSSQFANYGTVTWKGGDIRMELSDPQTDSCRFSNYSQFDVQCDNTIIDTLGGGFGYLGPVQFWNELDTDQSLSGTFIKTAGNGATTIGVFFRNYATVNKNGRTIEFPGGYSGEAPIN